MSRPPRLEVVDGIHHVWNRGNNRRRIYDDVATHRFFLSLWRQCGDRYAWRRLGYCLMPNHFHLIVETPEPTLGEGMRDLAGRYARWFNARLRTGGGHLFQERFGSRLVTSDRQLGQLLRYVAHNPVRAGLCGSPRDWAWSSHRAVLAARPHPLVDAERVLDLLEPLGGRRATRYRRLFASDGPLADVDPDVSPWEMRPVLAALLEHMDSTDAIAAARAHGYTLKEIAAETGLSEATVWRRAARAQGRAP